MRIFILAAMVLVASGFSAGCGTYTLQGKVVEGFESAILIVPADDPRLSEPGIPQVRITIHRDPGSLAQAVIASDSSDPDGAFAIELPAFGAGWMDEQWLVETSRPNYRNASRTFRLPSSAKRNRLLITVAPGRAAPHEHRDDLWEEYRRHR